MGEKTKCQDGETLGKLLQGRAENESRGASVTAVWGPAAQGALAEGAAGRA